MPKNNEKTNVVRLLETAKVPYRLHTYSAEEADSGTEVAAILHQDPARVFKTLVTAAKSRKNYVFVIPANEELDLKKAAAAVGEKSIEMLRSKDLLGLTGYIHGGCSPIGMKKFFPTVFHETAVDYETIFVSAGRRGFQIELSMAGMADMIRFELKDLIQK